MSASPMKKMTTKKFDLNEQLDMIRAKVPTTALEGLTDIYQEEEGEDEKSKSRISKSGTNRISRSNTKSRLLTDRSRSKSRILDDSDSETDPYAYSSYMDTEKVQKLKFVKGIDKKRYYKLLDDGHTNIEAQSRRNPDAVVLPIRIVDPAVMNAIIDE